MKQIRFYSLDLVFLCLYRQSKTLEGFLTSGTEHLWSTGADLRVRLALLLLLLLTSSMVLIHLPYFEWLRGAT